ncbi:hypothetical protein BgiBS90_020827 [Biomphalaria glabrata]|nr:hypothetical protein BgiBS90_020827 [Biomphalaria glabrata]
MAAAAGRMQRSQAEIEVPRKSDPRGGDKSAALPCLRRDVSPMLTDGEMAVEVWTDGSSPNFVIECVKRYYQNLDSSSTGFFASSHVLD